MSKPPPVSRRRGYLGLLLILLGSGVLLAEMLGVARPVLGLLPTLIQWALALLVARTLLPGRLPMVHKIALALHSDGSPLPKDIADYARGVTVLWAVVFGLLGALNLHWYFHPRGTGGGLPLAVDFGVIGVLILGEFFYRRRRYADYTVRSLPEFLKRLRRIDLRRIVTS